MTQRTVERSFSQDILILKECSFFFFAGVVRGIITALKVKGLACGLLREQLVRHRANTGVFHLLCHQSFPDFAFNYVIMVLCVSYIVISITSYCSCALFHSRTGEEWDE